MSNNRFEEGKKNTKQALQAGANAGGKLIGPQLGNFPKKMSKFMLDPKNMGYTLLIILLVACFALMMTSSASSLTSTDDMYTESVDYIREQTTSKYEAAKFTGSMKIKEYLEKTIEENGLYCGGVVITKDANGKEIPEGTTYDELSDDYDLSVMTIIYSGVEETASYSIEVEEANTPSDSQLAEMQEALKQELKEKLAESNPARACTVTLDFSPSFDDEVGIMVSYITAVNGAISDIAEVAYEEGTLEIEEDEDAEATPDASADATAEATSNTEMVDALQDEDKWADYIEENSSKYLSMTSKEFKDDFKAFVNHSTAKYKYQGETRTEDYTGLTGSIFYTIWNDKVWNSQLETKNGLTDLSVLNTEEWLNEVEVIHADTDTDRVMGYRTTSAEDSGCQALKVTPQDETCVISTTYTYTAKAVQSYKNNFTFTMPILYDLSEYRQRELTNIWNAYEDANAEEHKLNDETITAYLQDAISTKYQQEINLHNLSAAEDRLRAEIEELIDINDIYTSGGDTTSYFMGISMYTMTGNDGYEGRFDMDLLVDGSLNWSAYTYTCSGIFDKACLVIASNAIHEHAKQLHAQGHISAYSSEHWCTEVAQTWYYDHYGNDWLHGDGKLMAVNLVKEHPDEWEFGNSPAPGGIISMHPNHVLCVDAVWSDSSGELWVSVTDGHVLNSALEHGGGTRVMRDVKLKDLITNESMYSPIYANPKQN